MEIRIPNYFTSQKFYEEIVRSVNKAVGEEEIITLDFTEVQRMDAVVVPSLLVLGLYIRDKSGYMPVIRLGENIQAGHLKKYLYGIQFTKHARDVFLFENDPYNGMYGVRMHPSNTTQCFQYYTFDDLDEEEKRQKNFELQSEIMRRIELNLVPFLREFASEFVVNFSELVQDDLEIGNNYLAKYMFHLVENAYDHARSSIYITVQVNYMTQKVYISAADYGMGFKAAFLNALLGSKTQKESERFAYNILNREPQNELEAIIIGMYKRKYSASVKRGLYQVIEKTLDLNGLIRVHSNETQVIITQKIKNKFLNEELADDLLNGRLKYNVRSDVMLPGTHIEIEIPLK